MPLRTLDLHTKATLFKISHIAIYYLNILMLFMPPIHYFVFIMYCKTFTFEKYVPKKFCFRNLEITLISSTCKQNILFNNITMCQCSMNTIPTCHFVVTYLITSLWIYDYKTIPKRLDSNPFLLTSPRGWPTYRRKEGM